MNIPKRIKIGAHTYKIKIHDAYAVDTDSNCGIHYYSHLTMDISTRDPQGKPKANSVIHETFWHEVLHAINIVWNNNECNESQIDRMAQGLTQVLEQFRETK